MDTSVDFYQTELEIIQYTFDIMYHLSSIDMSESFLTSVFHLIVDNQFQENILEINHISASSLKIISLLDKIVNSYSKVKN